MEEDLGIVLYADGGAKPNPGNTGWGVHGYIYTNIRIEKPVFVGNFYITNRGYRSLRDEMTGDDIWYAKPIKYIDAFGSSIIKGTNNQAELLAIINSLTECKNHVVKSIDIISDSNYAITGINDYLEKWVRNSWRKSDGVYIVNIELWKEINELLTYFKTNNVDIRFSWTASHNGQLGNHQADILASIGVNYSTKGEALTRFEHTEVKNYWKVDKAKHPLLNLKWVYFNSVSKYNIPGHYYQASQEASEFLLGKRLPESCYSVIKLKEQDRILESVKLKQYDVTGEINSIFTIHTGSCYNKSIYPYIDKYGPFSFIKNRNSLGINFVDKTPITVEINPTGLSLRAVEYFNQLEELLEQFHDYDVNGCNQKSNIFKFNIHDITDQFYAPKKKSLALKDELTVGQKNIRVSINRYNIMYDILLLLGLDLPNRNVLKSIESLEPRICLVTWSECENTFKYATVITCNDAVGIWSNYFANRIFI